MNSLIPACYFSTRKILIDDDKALSSSILLKLRQENIQAFTSPKEALHYLTDEYQLCFNEENMFSKERFPEDYESNTIHLRNIHLDSLKTVLLDDKYQQDISVLIVDYHMPEMNGLELLETIEQPDLKRVLITSETDYKIAVDAFNQGLIHAYIRKDEPDFTEKLLAIIKKLEWDYFLTKTTTIVEAVNQESNYLSSNEVFSIFSQLIKKHEIISFCLLDKSGTFLMLDKNKNKKYFIMKTQDQLNEMANLAKEENASEEIISALQQGKVIPFFGENKEFWHIPTSDWETYFQQTNTMNNEKNKVWVFCQEK